jgi:HPt (histidine-containing phosphotransfer) domain-containing protein
MTPNTPTPPPLSLANALEALRQKYRASAPQLVAPFRELAQRLAVDPGSPAAAEAVRAAAHRLRGTAGSYGFAQVSQLASTLEHRAAGWGGGGNGPVSGVDLESRAALVAQFADALEVAFRAS